MQLGGVSRHSCEFRYCALLLLEDETPGTRRRRRRHRRILEPSIRDLSRARARRVCGSSVTIVEVDLKW